MKKVMLKGGPKIISQNKEYNKLCAHSNSAQNTVVGAKRRHSFINIVSLLILRCYKLSMINLLTLSLTELSKSVNLSLITGQIIHFSYLLYSLFFYHFSFLNSSFLNGFYLYS